MGKTSKYYYNCLVEYDWGDPRYTKYGLKSGRIRYTFQCKHWFRPIYDPIKIPWCWKRRRR
jgi:hypothetical protein